MAEIVVPVRAKEMYVETERVDKYGVRKPSKVRQHITLSDGMYSAKEMERMIPEVAQEYGVSEDRVKIEAYQKGEAPLEVNPRHRGIPPRMERPKTTHEVKPREFQRVRRVFAGGLPQTPEEWAAHVAEFEARRNV